MKRFVLRIIVFILFVLFLLVILDIFVSNRLRNNIDRRFITWTAIIQGDINADLLIVGSSRAREHFSPMILDSILNLNSYNLGMGGSTFNRQWERYQIYSLYNTKPQIIIQNIDFFSTLVYRFGYEREQYFPYFSNVDVMDIVQEPFYWYEYLPFCRYYGHNSLLKNSFQTDIITDSIYKGFQSYPYQYDGIELAKIDSFFFEYDEEVKELFEHYVAKVTSDSIKLVFVYTPLYIDGINKIKNLDQCYKIFNDIAVNYNVPILDYTYSKISYDTTYFRNASHLNRKGAELFSTMLANDLDSLGILK